MCQKTPLAVDLFAISRFAFPESSASGHMSSDTGVSFFTLVLAFLIVFHCCWFVTMWDWCMPKKFVVGEMLRKFSLTRGKEQAARQVHAE